MTTATNSVPETATLQMVRAEVNVREFQRWMGTRRLPDPDHAMHCLLTECFGPPPTREHPERGGLAPQPFRLIIPRGGSTGCLYGYGQSGADELREAAQLYGDPAQCQILNLPTLAAKSMPREWMVGKRLGFEVRVRPIVRRTCNAKDRAEKECDAFLHEALQFPEKGGMERTREQVYREWLAGQITRRGGVVLDLERTRLVSFQRSRAYRKLRARHSEGPDAVMRGILTVTDSDAFTDLLARGIGRHRAYGYGMLLLRPAQE